MKSILNKKRGQLRIGDAPGVVLIVLFLFMCMGTAAFVLDKYGDAMDAGSVGRNITEDLTVEVEDNVSIAGMVLTIALIGIVLSILIGLFYVFTGGGRRGGGGL